MKAFVAVIVVLAVAVVGVGFWQGWFSFKTTTDSGKSHIDLTVNKDKFKQDKEKLKTEISAKFQALKDKLAGLRKNSEGLTGDEKAKADKEIEELKKKHDAVETHLKNLDEATEDKFEDVKKNINSLFDEPKGGTGK
jgi:hypothetical protein